MSDVYFLGHAYHSHLEHHPIISRTPSFSPPVPDPSSIAVQSWIPSAPVPLHPSNRTPHSRPRRLRPAARLKRRSTVSLQKALIKWKSPGVVTAGEVAVIICPAGSGMALLPQPPHSQPHVLRDVTLLHHLHLFLALCPRSQDSRRSYSTGNHGCAPSWPQAWGEGEGEGKGMRTLDQVQA